MIPECLASTKGSQSFRPHMCASAHHSHLHLLQICKPVDLTHLKPDLEAFMAVRCAVFRQMAASLPAAWPALRIIYWASLRNGDECRILCVPSACAGCLRWVLAAVAQQLSDVCERILRGREVHQRCFDSLNHWGHLIVLCPLPSSSQVTNAWDRNPALFIDGSVEAAVRAVDGSRKIGAITTVFASPPSHTTM